MSDEVAENGHSDNGDVPEIELIIRVSITFLAVIWGVPKFATYMLESSPWKLSFARDRCGGLCGAAAAAAGVADAAKCRAAGGGLGPKAPLSNFSKLQGFDRAVAEVGLGLGSGIPKIVVDIGGNKGGGSARKREVVAREKYF